MRSLWEETNSIYSFPALDRNLETEVLIIGGGMAGILCAYLLEQAGVPYALVEATTIGNGISKNTIAKITAQHGLIYEKLIRTFGLERAKQYLAANALALETYSIWCASIPCDFERKPAFCYSLTDQRKIEAECNALEKLGASASYTDSVDLPFSVKGAICFPNQAQFHPLKFLAVISKGLHIYEQTKVQQLVGTTVHTNRGVIRAKKIIVATHFPIFNKQGSYFLKMYQSRSYVLALENAQKVNGMYIDEAENGMSFRNYGDLLLIGGGDHRTGKKGGNWKELRNFSSRYYPNAKERYHWATQDCMTLDSVPYIGPYSSKTQHLYVATGFNKWGMSTSMVAAMILCDQVQGKKHPFADAFSPSRSILHPQLAKNMWESMVSFLTPTTKRCPHLGCALKWNPYEHTWDCSCHGSRFTENGEVIDNPATDDL